ncbi:MAG: DUF3696 domain-containing protein [Rhodospirillales bacterium]|jgi:predicted ATPase
MLKRLVFSNFKSWAHADLHCAPITGVFGTNSSGKTSLIQFPLLLKQTKNATDRALALDLNGDLVKLGTIGDAIHQHDTTRFIDWGLAFELSKDLVLADPSEATAPSIARGHILDIYAKVDVHQGGPRTLALRYGLGELQFTLRTNEAQPNGFELRARSLMEKASSFQFKRSKGRPWQLPGPVNSYAFPDQARTYFQNAGFLADLEATYESALDKIFYLGPLREPPRRDYLWNRSRPSDVGVKGEKAVDAIIAATADGEQRNLVPKGRLRPFQEVVAHWLRKLGLIEGFRVEEIAKQNSFFVAKVTTRKGAAEVLLTDVGFGISQVLPVVTLLQYVPKGSTVILEQPEIHLHPLAQAELADVIVQAAIHRKVQVIFESHSEHLLLRLQRRVAEESLPADAVRLYFCDAPHGVSELEPLELDLYGRIRNWPEKFMGDAFGETAEAELARLKRMRTSP